LVERSEPNDDRSEDNVIVSRAGHLLLCPKTEVAMRVEGVGDPALLGTSGVGDDHRLPF
jgi:hypothetical protein